MRVAGASPSFYNDFKYAASRQYVLISTKEKEKQFLFREGDDECGNGHEGAGEGEPDTRVG